MSHSTLHERLRIAADGRTYRDLAALTGLNHETIRRYMTGQPPSTEFLARLCEALGLCANWLLTGRGPMHMEDERPAALAESSAGELFSAAGGSVAALERRIERLEAFLAAAETRSRLNSRLPASEIEPKRVGGRGDEQTPLEAADPLRHGQHRRNPEQRPPAGDAGPRHGTGGDGFAAAARAARIAAAAGRRPAPADRDAEADGG